jgi:hypothetical protein
MSDKNFCTSIESNEPATTRSNEPPSPRAVVLVLQQSIRDKPLDATDKHHCCTQDIRVQEQKRNESL